MLSTPPAFVLSQDQTLHKKISQKTNPLSWNESNQLAKNHHKQTIVCNWQKNNDLLYQKRGHHPMTGKK
ncbi:hypothetical protein B1A57_05460 [Corynebacterium diphtheriae]|nr:hypothetical protein B1A57_05460 [Corynebacterium diphtheriae]